MEENKKLTEEKLEGVAGADGGDVKSLDCWFDPVRPYEYTKAYGGVSVKCKTKCHTLFGEPCNCHGTVFCSDKYHLLDQDLHQPLRWYPFPKDTGAHQRGGILIEPLDVK